MQKKFLTPLFITLLGIILVIAAVALSKAIGSLWFTILLIVGILAILAGFYELREAFIKRRRGEAPEEPEREKPEYRKKRAVLTKNEWEFYQMLKGFLSSEHFEIFPETALVTVIEKLTQNSYRNELFRIADFCIADAGSSEPLLLIELNDASHNRADRVERDRKVAEICFRAGIPLITFTLEEAADEGQVKKTLKKYL